MKRLAIVGSGISGLSAGHLLHPQHQVTFFEREPQLGGHTATVDVRLGGRDRAIDTGFIVFNDRTYPLFLKLLERVGLKGQPTVMSFSVRSPEGLEYNGQDLDTLFAQRTNLLNPRFWSFLAEILRFNQRGRAALAEGKADAQTLGGFLSEGGFSDYFARHYILPMGAAIWSSTLADMRAIPAGFFLRFFENHGLLHVTNRPQWFVIPGGSREYIAPLTAGWSDAIRTSCPVHQIRREPEGVRVQSGAGEEIFDEVILACHSDEALALLGDATPEERQVLGDLPYQANEVLLHTDTSVLPRHRKAWASWNFLLDPDESARPLVTYQMNLLQGIEAPETFCVTLNPQGRVAEEKILRRFVYHHPVFSPKSLAAQQQRARICGVDRIHFCGAYWYNGFHEDGVRSANDVAGRFGCRL